MIVFVNTFLNPVFTVIFASRIISLEGKRIQLVSSRRSVNLHTPVTQCKAFAVNKTCTNNSRGYYRIAHRSEVPLPVAASTLPLDICLNPERSEGPRAVASPAPALIVPKCQGSGVLHIMIYHGCEHRRSYIPLSQIHGFAVNSTMMRDDCRGWQCLIAEVPNNGARLSLFPEISERPLVLFVL